MLALTHQSGRVGQLSVRNVTIGHPQTKIVKLTAPTEEFGSAIVRSDEENTKDFTALPEGRPVRPAVPVSIAETEEAIRHQDFETAHIWKTGKNGEEYYVVGRNGGSRGVRFPTEEEALIKDSVFIHNHPNDGAFSIADVRLIQNFDPVEFRAVGPSKRYVLKRPEGGWPKDLVKTWITNADRELNELKKKNVPPEKAVPRARVEAMKRIAKTLKLVYLQENS